MSFVGRAFSAALAMSCASSLSMKPGGKTGLRRHSGESDEVSSSSPLHSRREALAAVALGCLAFPCTSSAIGTLPETARLSRVAVQATIRVPAVQPVVDFLSKGLMMKTLRSSRDATGSLVTTMSFGPEEFAVPKAFIPGVSPFSEYGSHFSLNLVETPDTELDLGDGLAYLALGVPQYRISKLVEAGGSIVSSYGFTVVNAPGGFPLQVVLGDQVRDPCMFVALYVNDLKSSEKYYAQELGMTRLEYPRARTALVSPFEPPQPKGSVFMGYSEDTFGVLLLPRPKRGAKKKELIRPGNVWGGLRIVAGQELLGTPGNKAVASIIANSEPNGYPIEFVDEDFFFQEISGR